MTYMHFFSMDDGDLDSDITFDSMIINQISIMRPLLTNNTDKETS